jgi:glutamine synthetase
MDRFQNAALEFLIVQQYEFDQEYARKRACHARAISRCMNRLVDAGVPYEEVIHRVGEIQVELARRTHEAKKLGQLRDS